MFSCGHGFAAEVATARKSRRAPVTSAAVTETVTTVDEVAQTAEQAAQRARAVADSALRAAEIGKSGRKAVEERFTVERMADKYLALYRRLHGLAGVVSPALRAYAAMATSADTGGSDRDA